MSVELPLPENTPLFEMVTKCLLHGPCGQEYPNAPCMVNGLCKKRYPRTFSKEITQGEDGYPVYRRRNDGRTFQKTPDGFAYNNQWVVPHNPYLTKMFNAHINVEVSAGIRSVKYLFKYVYKGPNRVTAVITGPINEIRQYIDARYLSTAEGVDSLLLFKKHMEWPLATRLVVHLLRQHNVNFNENENLAAMVKRAAHQKTTLTAYFAYNAQNANGRNVVYADFLIMFGKFKKKFGQLDNEEKKLLGECILYILLLVNVSSSASYLLSYRARPLSNISGLLTT